VKASWVILTRGDRPEELERAVRSVAGQTHADSEIVVVGNGTDAQPPAPARGVSLPENVGAPGGRNVGVAETDGDVVFFLDDDAECPSPDLTAATLALFDADPALGIVAFRIFDPASGTTQRRHVPRLCAGDPARSSPVTTFLEGAVAVRRRVFDDVGEFAAPFVYAMEASDFAWRAIDAGWKVEYRGDLVVHHPATSPGRHPDAVWRTARNRVWLVRRRLPWPLAVTYLAVWLVLTLARSRSWSEVAGTVKGLRDGLRTDAGERRPIRWRTAWRMTRMGRPPVI
jgi:hypothetical protein